MIIILALVLIIIAFIYFFTHQPSFGQAPSGQRLELIKRSPNYRDGQFQNLSPTPALTEGVSYFGVLKEFFFTKKYRVKPTGPLPSKKTDLLSLSPEENVLVWFGHSSYYLQVDGKKILVDPVFSGNASPVSFTTRSFPGTDIYTTDDMPEIDYLFISHDHWDHADHQTLVKMRRKVKTVITGLGVGAHLERWGYNPDCIREKDWNEEVSLGDGFTVHTAPARHFSGRSFKRNGSLWLSFVLLTPGFRLYLGGDSGYDTHFKTIGERFGPFDLAILEDGQYDKSWKYIHMMPEEVVQAAEDLRARKLMPVHWSKFALANHAWDDPIIRITKEAERKHMTLLTPMIGEKSELAVLS
jgi:L-ascorbate metabolism protein UlaG (beta-lactamase superfamily)